MIAIIITIMVLEIKVPHEVSLDALLKLAPVFLSYVISFLYIGIYWNNHHHLLQSTQKINGGVLWANMGLLFCLSLVPFSSGWMGENHFEGITVTLYGVTLLACAIAYYILTLKLLKIHDRNAPIHKAVGNKFKEQGSMVLYVAGLVLSFWFPWIAFGLYILVVIIWLVPDRRIESALEGKT